MKSCLFLLVFFIAVSNSSKVFANDFSDLIGKYQIDEKLVCRGMNEPMMELHNRNFGEDLGYIYMNTCVHETKFFGVDVMDLSGFTILKSNKEITISLDFGNNTKSWVIDNQKEPSNWNGSPLLIKYGKFISSYSEITYYWSGFYGLLDRAPFEIQIFEEDNTIVIESEPRGRRSTGRAKFKFRKTTY